MKMSLVIPFHSTKEGCEVYHDNSNCDEGHNIEERYFQRGRGGKRLCEHCAKINYELRIKALTALGNLYLTTGFLPLRIRSKK